MLAEEYYVWAQLLSAVTLDGNKNVFPIAHAIVEKENKDIWQ